MRFSVSGRQSRTNFASRKLSYFLRDPVHGGGEWQKYLVEPHHLIAKRIQFILATRSKLDNAIVHFNEAQDHRAANEHPMSGLDALLIGPDCAEMIAQGLTALFSQVHFL